jgi:pimeloyl-ACP methyl ester carboxylesterase
VNAGATDAADAIWREEAGPVDGPPVVLVHGSMDRSAGLLKLSRRLDDSARVLRYDRRGYGRSRPHPGPFRIDDHVDDLVGVLAERAATVEQGTFDRGTVVFGHSYGGNVALRLAERHPDVVRAVVVYETPLSWLAWWPDSTAGSVALAAEQDPADAAERFMRRLIGDERWERLPPGTRAARRQEGVAMVGELTDLREHRAWDASRIAVPVVAMHGESGAEHHRRAIEHLGHVLDDCEVVEVPGARHFGPNTHPDAVASVVRGLLTDVGGEAILRPRDEHQAAGDGGGTTRQQQ